MGAEGWGLTGPDPSSDPSGAFYATDSRDRLYKLDPSDLFSESDSVLASKQPVQITDPRLRGLYQHSGSAFPILGVNELEMVDSEVWGNLYPMYEGSSSECLVRMEPKTGLVQGWVDLTGLLSKQSDEVKRQARNYVLNGIAYNEQTGLMLVTGKEWEFLYEIEIVPSTLNEQQSVDWVKTNCGLGNPARSRHRFARG